MSQAAPIWSSLEAFIASEQPDEPVFFLSPSAVTAGARAFLDGFPGFVTYAVKANPAPAVLLGLIAAGVRGFDVASPDEIAMLRRLCPEAALHYHNPIKSRSELRFALQHDVRTYSVDNRAELEKMIEVFTAEADPARIELSIRFRMPVKGGAYDFGTKFGATEEYATELLARAAEAGVPALRLGDRVESIRGRRRACHAPHHIPISENVKPEPCPHTDTRQLTTSPCIARHGEVVNPG